MSDNAKPSEADLLAAALKQVPMFAELDAVYRLQLAQYCRRRWIDAPGVLLFREGDDPGSLYVIMSGMVRVQSMTSGGKPVFIAQLGAGEAVGELALLDGEPRMADVITESPCDLLVVRREAFLRCVRENPDIAFSVMAMLARRLRETARQQTAREDQDVTGRLAQLLVAEMDRNGVPEGRTGHIRLGTRKTHLQMAEQIGSSRETVTRALAEMRRLQILDTEGRDLIVINPERLRSQATR